MFKPLRGFDWYSYTGSYLSFQYAFLLFFAAIAIGVAGFIWLEGYSFVEAFYMTVITISTVGYTEVRPLSDNGQIFVSFLIILNIGIFAYAISAFTFYVIQGEYFKNLHLKFLERKINELKDHVIICGFGKHGKEIAEHFLNHNVPFVVIEKNEEEIDEIRRSEAHVLYIEDDATHDDALVKAGIERARAIITALPEDSGNLFTVLSARQMNPRLTIISRAFDPKSVVKLRRAGANHVIMPEQIGGYYMATLVSKPGAVEFFSFLTDNYGSDIEFDELDFDNLPEPCRSSTINELKLRQNSGVNIIGYKSPNGHFIVNPSPDTKLIPGASFIILGSSNHMKNLRKYLEEYAG
jgi:voltage-gated potassium channel